MKQMIALALSLLLAVFQATGQNNENKKPRVSLVVQVGGQNVKLVAIRDYLEVSQVFPEVTRTWETFVPPANRLLAWFAHTNDIAKEIQGENPTFRRALQVQIVRSWASATYNLKSFADMRAEIRAALKQSVENFSAPLDWEYLLANYKVSIGKPIQLGVFHDKDDVLAFGMLVPAKISVGNKQKDYVQFVASTVCLVNGKVLFLYVKTPFETKGDVEWAENYAKDWAKEVIKVNGLNELGQQESGASTAKKILNYTSLGKSLNLGYMCIISYVRSNIFGAVNVCVIDSTPA